jgi:hypothetical protein
MFQKHPKGSNFIEFYKNRVRTHRTRRTSVLRHSYRRVFLALPQMIGWESDPNGRARRSSRDFLVKGVTQGLETDAPYVTRFDSQPGPSQEFTDWASAHNITTDAALETLYNSALAMSLLAKTGDRRGIPLLRRGLSSPYFLTQTSAAEGLAKIQDKESIPLIIEACKKAPAAAASVIARYLVYFDDPEAQRAVDTYIPKDMAKLYREARASGRDPFGVRPLHQ